VTSQSKTFLQPINIRLIKAWQNESLSLYNWVIQHTNTRKLCYRKDDRAMRAIYVDREPLRRYGHSKLSKMAAAAILNLFESKIAPLDPPSPKTPPYN